MIFSAVFKTIADFLYKIGLPILYILSYSVFLYIKKGAIRRVNILRLNYTIMLFAVGVIIAYIFGLNSSILASYDKIKGTAHFDFTNPKDAMLFPFLMMEKYDTTKTLTDIDLNKSNLSGKTNYVLVIDRSLSTKITKDSAIIKAFINDVKSEIHNAENSINIDKEPDIKIPDSLDLNDYIALYFIRQMYNRNSNDSGRTFQILLYKGDGILDKIYKSKCDISNFEIAEAYKVYFENAKIKKRGRFTDFTKLLSFIRDAKVMKSAQMATTHVIIMSDFEHEDDSTVSFNDLEKYISDPYSQKEMTLSLFRLINDKPKPYLSDKTIEILNKYFLNSKNYLFNEISVLNNEKSYQAYLNSVFSIRILDSEQQINLFFPNCNSHNITTCKSKLVLHSSGNENKDHLFSFTNQNYPYIDKIGYLKIDDKNVLYTNEHMPLQVSTGPLKVEINMDNRMVNDNFLEISVPGKLISHQYKINILEQLSNTSLLILSLSYLILLSILITNSAIYLYFGVATVRKKYNRYMFANKKQFDIDRYKNISKLINLECFSLIVIHGVIILLLLPVFVIDISVFFDYYKIYAICFVALFLLYVTINIGYPRKVLLHHRIHEKRP